MSARASTRARVLEAALSLAREAGLSALTMEGIAARAGAGKQTLYRSWPSPAAIGLDALLAESRASDGSVEIPDTGDLHADLISLVTATIQELGEPGTDRLLRAVVADMQHDSTLGAQVVDRLLGPQLRAVAARLDRDSVADADDVAELLMGPLFHRWLLRTRPFAADWPADHVGRVLRASVRTPGSP